MNGAEIDAQTGLNRVNIFGTCREYVPVSAILGIPAAFVQIAVRRKPGIRVGNGYNWRISLTVSTLSMCSPFQA